jgi:hypothetical protein
MDAPALRVASGDLRILSKLFDGRKSLCDLLLPASIFPLPHLPWYN